ncbi:hypothetical protein V5P93_004646 [Actinokineospora auranticolor]|uniref:DUF3558 domain-containing protein n=1 Tax=Actinokineospora auranticolor TaxID=155976 RepID=A0A2S6GBR2_9PSEU|nr:hypothetical protein [Actinokineospora auranticolor]PPK61469.1 hypothetical protein CLV40_14119 [Actinokineospora auranticolor]
MRQLVIVLLFGLAACSAAPGTAQPVPARSTGAAGAASPNPCELVTRETLDSAFPDATAIAPVTADGVEPGNPPANGASGERDCGYAVTVPGVFGDNPGTDSASRFTVMVATYAEDRDGTTWDALSRGTGTRPATNIGDAAFFRGEGDLTAHRGPVIVHVWSADDVDGVLDDQRVTGIVLRALAP